MTAHWNYDYTKTLWMKMFLAKPDFANGRSEVLIDFEHALGIIKAVNNLTPGVKKIIYLVGWQGLGHDDCYPEMEVVNEALKFPGDKTAAESMWRLFEEAKKYDTVVSFHGNLADAYEATPSFPQLAAANAVVKGTDGKPAVIEVFNGRNAYKVSYKGYWESGLFKKHWDRFCEVTPVRQAGTVHLDNFCIAQSLNPYTSVEEENDARNRMLDYILSLGIDVTTEYTYRELEMRADSPEHPIRKFYATAGRRLPESDWRDAPIRLLGRIAASWWTSGMTAEDCIRVSPALYSGRLTEPRLLRAFYGAMHGEDIWMERGADPADWKDAFLRDFCTLQLPYFYLNRYERLAAREDGDELTVRFSEGVVSRGATGEITKNGVVLKTGGDVLLPLTPDGRAFIAYSAAGRTGEWNAPDAAFAEAEVFELTPEGRRPLGRVKNENGKITLNVLPGQALLLR